MHISYKHRELYISVTGIDVFMQRRRRQGRGRGMRVWGGGSGRGQTLGYRLAGVSTGLCVVPDIPRIPSFPACHPAILVSCRPTILPPHRPAILLFWYPAVLPFCHLTVLPSCLRHPVLNMTLISIPAAAAHSLIQLQESLPACPSPSLPSPSSSRSHSCPAPAQPSPARR
ncbi:hypothetical protein E2C01_101299 [Portunus trituberculatus]|uniref:Uncharacterized protein n=1 Tax=Portunus trituberculatus TaxID=210409 RepID=A0A5B7KEE5_PORTR|nr:hypothetical protein [Portunus trituberculatus]